MWKNIVQPDRPQTTILHIRISRWIPKATNTHSQYALLITVPLQQWLHERVSMLRYTYTACLRFIFSCSSFLLLLLFFFSFAFSSYIYIALCSFHLPCFSSFFRILSPFIPVFSLPSLISSLFLSF